MMETVLSELREVRSDIRNLHDDVHGLELKFVKLQTRIKTTVSFISVAVGSIFGIVTTFLKR